MVLGAGLLTVRRTPAPEPPGMVRRRVGDGVGGVHLRCRLGHVGQHLPEGDQSDGPCVPILTRLSQFAPVGRDGSTPRRQEFLAGQGQRGGVHCASRAIRRPLGIEGIHDVVEAPKYCDQEHGVRKVLKHRNIPPVPPAAQYHTIQMTRQPSRRSHCADAQGCYINPVSAKRTANRSAKATEWLVYRLGGPRAAFLGHVIAPNQEAALAVAYEEFGIISLAERRRDHRAADGQRLIRKMPS
jgi:hypothetical protein